MYLQLAGALVAGCVACAYIMVRRTSRVWVVGGGYALPLWNRYNFSFRVVLDNAEDARRCASYIELPDVNVGVEQTANGKWALVGATQMRPLGRKFDEIVAAIARALDRAGHRDATILTEANLPGVPVGLLLMNDSLR